MLAFPSAPPHTHTRGAPAARPLAWPESQPSSFGPRTQLTDFFQIIPNPPRTLPVHDVIHIPKSYLGFLF